MPGPGATKKAAKSKPAPYDAGFLEGDELFDPNTIRAADKKKGKNATSKKKDQPNDGEEMYVEEVTPALSASPNGPPSILERLPSFRQTNAPADILDVLNESVKVSDQYSARTNAWAQDVPYGKSPPGNSTMGEIVGESPPVHGAYLGRGGFNTKTPPRSPAQRKSRPVSFGSAIPPMPARQQSEYGYRQTPSNYGSPPALPHLPQQHFYAAQDINLGLAHQKFKEDTQRTFMAFRPLPIGTPRPQGASRVGIFVGSEGRLDILAASVDGKYEGIGALVGLPGDVTDAMPLTWESGPDPFSSQRPLVAVVLHGKGVPHDRDTSDTESIATGIPYGYGDPNQELYETRVEVHSLRDQTYIATLLQIPSVAFSSLAQGHTGPDPVGDLCLHAFGNHLVISSGVSGEVFVFGITPSGNEPKIECLAKYWTSVQAQEERRNSSHSRSPRAAITDTGLDQPIHQSAILGGKGRWLAICPPGLSHRPTLSAQTTRTSKRSKASASILSRSPPAKPPTTCATESPDVETLLGTIARGAAQQVVRGASWIGSQGIQAWNGYWNKDQQPQQLPPATSNYLYSPRQVPQHGMFPPTHAAEPVTRREPDVVSIIDLKTMSTVATFQPPKGCSFLSFTPTGLGLLTSSKKGDVQYVWDLMQMKHVENLVMIEDSTTTETAVAPRVRQIAKFERMTPSTIVEVLWEPAFGERFALVTKKGTIHLWDLPRSAFRWPPPRQGSTIRPATAPPNPASAGDLDTPSPSGFLASAWSIANKAPPMFATLRGRAPPTIGQGLAGVGATGVGIASATGARGGRAVAAGLSRSLGAATGTMQNLRHAGETRLHVEALAAYPAPGMIAFGMRGKATIISVLDKGSVKDHYITRTPMRDRNNRVQMTAVFGKKAGSFKLPHIASLVQLQEAQNHENPQDTPRLSGFWPTHMSDRVSKDKAKHSQPLSHVEIDSTSPYVPFHSDRRVNLSVYSDEQTTTSASSANPATKWVFGEPIPASRLNTQSSRLPQEDGEEDQFIDRETSDTTGFGRGEIPEQVVSKTRKKRNKNAGQASTMIGQNKGAEGRKDDGFFEDDVDALDADEPAPKVGMD